MGTLLANRLKTNESQNATIHSYTPRMFQTHDSVELCPGIGQNARFGLPLCAGAIHCAGSGPPWEALGP